MPNFFLVVDKKGLRGKKRTKISNHKKYKQTNVHEASIKTIIMNQDQQLTGSFSLSFLCLLF